MDFGQPAHSFAQAVTRIAILLVLVPGFFVTCGVGIWLGDRWFGPLNQGYSRAAGLPLGFGLALYAMVTFVLMQFW